MLSWRLSNSMTVDFCFEAVEAAIQDCGIPDIMNTDQGSHFPVAVIVDQVLWHGTQMSMDGNSF
jgi:putative transposase